MVMVKLCSVRSPKYRMGAGRARISKSLYEGLHKPDAQQDMNESNAAME